MYFIKNMVQTYTLTIPENVTSDRLKTDLEKIISQYEGFLYFREPPSSKEDVKDIRIYRMPSDWTITLITNDRNYFELNDTCSSDNYKCSGYMVLTYFNKVPENYFNLLLDFANLKEGYKSRNS